MIMGYWYFRYPFKTMGISQNYHGSYSHKKYSTGNKKDYPIDEAGSDTGRDWMYAMNDLVVKKIYGLVFNKMQQILNSNSDIEFSENLITLNSEKQM